MKVLIRPAIFTCLFFSGLSASPDPDSPGIYGVYSESNLSSLEGVAPGSNILIYSGDFPVGPPAPQTAAGFPLATSLAGTSVQATVGSVTVDAYILGVEAQWVRAMLPSSTPPGDGRLIVTYNGRASVPYRLHVVERQVGIYDGSWCRSSPERRPPSFCVPRAVQNVDSGGTVSVNSLVTPARPGQLVALWGTGLGLAPGNEAAGPIPGLLEIPGLQVLMGGRPVKIRYSGRSGCCAGMDEIIFEVPPGIEGCNVPVWVRYREDGSATSDVLVSIASGTGACSDSQGLSEVEVRKLAAGGLKAASILSTPAGLGIPDRCRRRTDSARAPTDVDRGALRQRLLQWPGRSSVRDGKLYGRQRRRRAGDRTVSVDLPLPRVCFNVDQPRRVSKPGVRGIDCFLERGGCRRRSRF